MCNSEEFFFINVNSVTMVVVSCPVPDCTFKTDDLEQGVITVLLQLHLTVHSQGSNVTKGPKLDRPRIQAGVSQEVWNTFVRRWNAFRIGSGISDSAASIQLFQCADEELANNLLKSKSEITSLRIDDALAEMRLMAVIPVAKGILRAELMQMGQSNDENFRTFAARVRGKAETCGFAVPVQCSCNKQFSLDYTVEVIRDVLLAGIGSVEIRQEALSAEGMQTNSINDVISFVEKREMARSAVSHTVLSVAPSKHCNIECSSTSSPSTSVAMSSFKQRSKDSQVVCPECKCLFHPFKKSRYGWNKKAFKQCLKCWQNINRRPSADVEVKANECAMNQSTQRASVINLSVRNEISDHCVYKRGAWKKSTFLDHPRIQFQLRDENNYRRVAVTGVADTGAQSNLWGLAEFEAAGFSQRNLNPVSVRVNAANDNPINIVGAFRGVFEGLSSDGKTVSCRSMVYVSNSVSGFLVLFETLL